MSAGRILALAGRILNQFRHDRRTVALIAIVPLVVTALIGYLVSEDKEPLDVAVVNLDAGAQAPIGPIGQVNVGEELVEALHDAGGIEPVAYEDARRAEHDVGAQDVAGAVILPAGLTTQLLAGERASIEVVVRGVDSGVDAPVLLGTQRAIATMADRLARVAPQGAPSFGGIQVERVSTSGIRVLPSLDYSAAVLIVAFAFLFTYLLTGISFLRERQSGTLERLMASPITRLEVLLGYLLGFLGFAMIQALLILGYIVVVLDVRVAGSIWLVLLILAIMVIGVVNVGIALSFLARNELQVMQFIPLVFVPQVLLGGLVWPVETLHPVLRWISQVFPITHAGAALREVMVGGAGFADVVDRVLAVLAFAVVMVLVGVVALRRQAA
jgi:ABC-2 type transport system permease protein